MKQKENEVSFGHDGYELLSSRAQKRDDSYGLRWFYQGAEYRWEVIEAQGWQNTIGQGKTCGVIPKANKSATEHANIQKAKKEEAVWKGKTETEMPGPQGRGTSGFGRIKSGIWRGISNVSVKGKWVKQVLKSPSCLAEVV